MGISAPSFDYNSLATPGGIGQGLASLGGALADASARRRQAEVEQARLDFEKQGLARLQANDLANRSQQAMQFQDSVNHNRAQEEYQQGQLKRQDGLAALANTRYNADAERQKTLDAAAVMERGYQHERQGKLDASAMEFNAARAKHYATAMPSVARDPFALRPETYLEGAKVAAKRAQDRISQEEMSPEYQNQVKESQKWGFGGLRSVGAAPASPASKYDAYYQEEIGKLGLPAKPPVWHSSTPVQTGNTDSHVTPSAPSLRDRVTALYGNDLHPDIEKSLAEAETGDQESAAQLKGILQQHAGAQEGEGAAETVAPGEERDLFGNPRYPR